MTRNRLVKQTYIQRLLAHCVSYLGASRKLDTIQVLLERFKAELCSQSESLQCTVVLAWIQLVSLLWPGLTVP